MKREDILIESKNIVTNGRNKEYGEPENNFQNIAEQWELYIQQKYKVNIKLNPEDVAWMMADFKKCRSYEAPENVDNYIDAIGYISCAGEIIKQ